MFKNALVSVSDKKGLEDFLKPLSLHGLRIVSSGGTAKYLKQQGLEVVSVSEQTQFPEVMGGRVKTLHPHIHMPLLYRDQDHDLLKEHKLQAFDLVVVNLYPFEEALKKGLSEEEMIEFIDIGGPTLLRAAAKNFKNICVVCDPNDYQWLLDKKEITLEDRKFLASKVFQHVSRYDSLITNYLSGGKNDSLRGELQDKLRYGENPQQEGYWYKSENWGLHQAEIVQGKALSYNNLLDLDAACRTLRMFDEPTVISVKHNNPCGVASDTDVHKALQKSLKADPVSVFGGIIAANQELGAESAQELVQLFLECVVAPSFTQEALEVFKTKKNLRVLSWKQLAETAGTTSSEYRSILGGYLVQSQDNTVDETQNWQFIGEKATEEEMKELLFAWRTCAALKSNAIAITSEQQSVGLGMGQVNRVDAVKQALDRSQQFHPDKKTLYMASDAFFPFPDSIEVAAKNGVQWIVQPGGSIKDKDVIEAAQRLNIKMALTGQRHFRH